MNAANTAFNNISESNIFQLKKSEETQDKKILALLDKPATLKAIKVTVGVREGFLDNKYEIIEDDKFRFDNTPEKKEFIKNLLTTTEFDLLEATKQEKLKIGHLEIKLPKSNGEFSVKTLQEIYDSE
jgi:hypothetical protein